MTPVASWLLQVADFGSARSATQEGYADAAQVPPHESAATTSEPGGVQRVLVSLNGVRSTTMQGSNGAANVCAAAEVWWCLEVPVSGRPHAGWTVQRAHIRPVLCQHTCSQLASLWQQHVTCRMVQHFCAALLCGPRRPQRCYFLSDLQSGKPPISPTTSRRQVKHTDSFTQLARGGGSEAMQVQASDLFVQTGDAVCACRGHSCRTTAVCQPRVLTCHSLTVWQPSVHIMPLRGAGGCTSCLNVPCQRTAGILPGSLMIQMPCCSSPQSHAQGVLQEPPCQDEPQCMLSFRCLSQSCSDGGGACDLPPRTGLGSPKPDSSLHC